MRKPVKRRSPGRRLFQLFFNSASALAIIAGNFIVRNPVLTGGATAFAVVMGFVSANALWYQPQAHDAVFFKTRSDFIFKATPRATLPSTMAAEHAVEKPAEPAKSVATVLQDMEPSQELAGLSPDRLQVTGSIDEMLPALAPNADLEIARLQQRLSTLGIYKGQVDGFSGPQTREAVERWQGLQAKLGVMQKKPAPGRNAVFASRDSKQDDVAKIMQKSGEFVVPVPRPQPVVAVKEAPAKRAPDLASLQSKVTPERKPPELVPAAQQQAKVSSQDIVRVQAGLKAFGNDRVSVDGVPGKSTQEAVREFQKLFGLPMTGEIDAVLIGKMREIGLIS
ncbi:peptidoglycan-binding protein [Falsochrobactrum sp. TDYN1]|uniref:Peptidoglycan-binding protein n=1 Tax=Falsochrobactrum tianjinense TaxID=2706015 RepID=A0A949PMK3_9HYPH|nr:peptidoglycan-binding domain-containing protein [Falsochrobactrum sp. TDYN1]MBV2142631.1 peptidoglycan-binding protein [Falsochrobactrum sp. TDYN1]